MVIVTMVANNCKSEFCFNLRSFINQSFKLSIYFISPFHSLRNFCSKDSLIIKVSLIAIVHTGSALLKMSLQNLTTFDPFADASGEGEDGTKETLVHVRIQQRNGRKTLTTVQGLSSAYDLKKIVRACKKEFACNGTVIEHPEYGEVLQLQGDQRENVCQWLTKCGLVTSGQLKVHGF